MNVCKNANGMSENDVNLINFIENHEASFTTLPRFLNTTLYSNDGFRLSMTIHCRSSLMIFRQIFVLQNTLFLHVTFLFILLHCHYIFHAEMSDENVT